MTVRTTVRAACASMLLAGAMVGVSATGALAQTAPGCDAYSGGCAPDQAGVSPATDVAPVSTGNNSAGSGELPFTGAEIALMSSLAALAVVGGTGFVIAGRRRAGSEASA